MQSGQRNLSSSEQQGLKFTTFIESQPLSEDKAQNKNGGSLSDQSNSSSSFDQKYCREQNQPLLKYFNQKECQICSDCTNSQNMLLCDKCEDGYHLSCLKIQSIQQDQTWICPRCIHQENQFIKMGKDIQLQISEKEKTQCSKCNRPLEWEVEDAVYFNSGKQEVTVRFEGQFQSQRCVYCKRLFHFECFNIRSNGLNCSKCERNIRESCPKGHQKFVDYYKEKYSVWKQRKFFSLSPLPQFLAQDNLQHYPELGFKLAAPVVSWQLITQYEASIYYAFQTKMLDFTEDQIYDDQEAMTLNRWDGEFMPILQLHPQDEKVFQEFKKNTTNGVIVGPYEVKQDRVKGFHIVATDFIEKMTIITEYVGEVVPARKSLFQHNQNDSVFILIKNPRSCNSLDIVPHQFGNIGRFFSGINNQSKKARQLLNVQVRRFSYQGRVRIIFYAAKNIQAGDQLFFDYNGGPFNQYPTQNFKL